MGTARTTLRDSTGMTVAEVIIALGIISVGLLALIAAMPLSTSQIGEAGLKTTATFLAQQRMEQIKNAQWTFAPAVDGLGGAGSNGGGAVGQWPDEGYNTIVIAMGGGNASYPAFRRQVRIVDCSVITCSGIAPGTGSTNTLRQVTVAVFFFPIAGTGMRGTTEDNVVLSTLVTRRP